MCEKEGGGSMYFLSVSHPTLTLYLLLRVGIDSREHNVCQGGVYWQWCVCVCMRVFET